MDCKFILVFMCVTLAFGEETTTEIYEESTEVWTTVQPAVRNKTLSDLVKEQTEAIRKILSENKGGQKVEYPEKVVIKQATKEEKEKQSIEELKLKCMNFFKLGYGGETTTTTTTTEQPEKTAIPFGPAMKPEFLKPRPSVENAGNFFYITHHPAEIFAYHNTKIGDKLEVAASDITEFTEKPQEIFTDPPTTERVTEMPSKEVENKPQKYKYVKLEPLVLQKTMLTNGKTYFYWYKPLPSTQSFVQIPDIPENTNVETIAQPQNEPSKKVPLPEQYQYYMDPNTGNIIRNLKPKPTTSPQMPQENVYKQAPQFYRNPQNGMIYQHATPQLVYSKKPEQPTEAPATETPKTVPNYTVEYPQNPPQNNGIRYVIPMVVASQEELEKYHMNPSALLANKKLISFPLNYFNNFQDVKPTEETK